jgi:hypothetical protein
MTLTLIKLVSPSGLGKTCRSELTITEFARPAAAYTARMATGRASEAQPARADLGPSLPSLLRRRFGFRERVSTAVAVGAVAAVAAGVLVHWYATRPEQVVVRTGGTAFNLQYSPDVLHRVAPTGGALVRLEHRRGKLSASITVLPLRLPPYRDNVAAGLLPVYANQHERRLRRVEPGFLLRDEATAKVNGGQGYQIGFRSGPPGRFTWGRDILLLPRDVNVRDGVVLQLRQTKVGSVNKHDMKILDEVRRAFKSFDFGTDRATW